MVKVYAPLRRVLFLFSAFLVALPFVTARGQTGVSPLNRVVEMMAWMFDIPILQNPMVQLGFMRFMLFILFLAVAHYGLKKAFPNKTAGIVATVFALIASFLMPTAWVTANGGVITAIFTGAIPLGVIGFLIYFCVKNLNENFATRLIALVILFMCLAIIDVYYTALGLPIFLFATPAIVKKYFQGER